MQKHHSTLQVLAMVLSASLGTVLMGYQMGVYGTLIDIIHIEFKLNSNNDGLITAMVPLGAMIGALLCKFCQKAPRRLVFILADIVTVLGLAMTAAVQYSCLLIGRFIVGMAIGVNSTIIPIYINEVSPVQVNGLMGSIFQTMCNVGFLLVFGMGVNVPSVNSYVKQPNQWWRVMFLFPIVIVALRSIIFLFIFTMDTADYYILAGKKEQAEKALQKVYKEEFVEDELVMVQIVNKSNKQVDFSELFTRKYAYRLAVGFSLPVIQQLSGINAILFYSTQIVQGDHPTPQQNNTAKIITAVIGFLLTLSALLGGKFIDKFGRKIVLILGELICIVCLLALALLSQWYSDEKAIQISFILLFVFGFGVSLGPIVWLYIAEILPSSACSITTLINWFTCGLVGFTFPYIKSSSIGIAGCFLIFAVSSIAGLIFIIVFVKETRNKTTEQIEAMFSDSVVVEYGEVEDGKDKLLV